MPLPEPDGAEALLVNGGGIDGGQGAYFADAGEDVHCVGSFAGLGHPSTASSSSPTAPACLAGSSATRWPSSRILRRRVPGHSPSDRRAPSFVWFRYHQMGGDVVP